MTEPHQEVALAGEDTLPPDVMLAPAQGASRPSEARVLRPRRAAPSEAIRPTRAEVNLAALRHNLRVLQRTLSADTAKRAAIWGVLKADGYGHGAPAVARTLERAGLDGLCVALLEEAIELRSAGITLPIIVMGGYFGASRDGVDELIQHDLIPVVYEPGQVERLRAVVASEQLPRPLQVHLKVDTGMARLGAAPSELDRMLEALMSAPELRVDGLMTHFACADEPDPGLTRRQLALFDQATARARAAGLAPQVRHAANSAAMLRFPEARLDAVRPGIALFGVSPEVAGAGPLSADLHPVMRVRSEVVAMRVIEAGEAVGYGHTWTAQRRTTVATVPIGYADGLSRQLSNRGHALVGGRRAPIVGVVSMDMVMLDVTDVPCAALRSEAVFLGAQEGPLGRDVITANEVAAHAGTIPWEILTNISRRVPRFYREP